MLRPAGGFPAVFSDSPDAGGEIRGEGAVLYFFVAPRLCRGFAPAGSVVGNNDTQVLNFDTP